LGAGFWACWGGGKEALGTDHMGRNAFKDSDPLWRRQSAQPAGEDIKLGKGENYPSIGGSIFSKPPSAFVRE